MVLCKVLTVFAVFLVVSINARYYEESYSIPEPKVQVFTPRGFRVSIEDAPGVRLFAFHGNINKELRDLEPGVFSKDILRKRNGRWTFEERNTQLEVGDVIHYWLFVIKDDLGYRLDDGHFEVKELLTSPFPTNVPPSGPNREPPKRDPNGSKPETCIPTEDLSPITTPPPDIDRLAILSVCELTVLNATQALLSMQTQLDELRKTNQQLTTLIEKYPDGKKLTLSGRIPPEDEALMTARFVIREKLEINPDITSAVRNEDNSITFELATLAEKLEILEVAKLKLKNSRIFVS